MTEARLEIARYQEAFQQISDLTEEIRQYIDSLSYEQMKSTPRLTIEAKLRALRQLLI